MLPNLKALVVVLAFAVVTFRVAAPLCLRFMSVETFTRRRNLWFALTIVAFASPSFWIFAAFALIALAVAASRDENPLALYLFVVFVIPNVSIPIPSVIINQFFSLSHYRILSLVILIPVVWRLATVQPGVRSFRTEDGLLAAFLLLQVVLFMPYEALTNTARRAFLFLLDTFVVFYAFARVSDRDKIADAMAAFWMAALLMAPVAVFENLKGWMLYTGLNSYWGDPNEFSWLFRGESLRAQASSGHSLNLGFQLAMGFGAYLYLRLRNPSRLSDAVILATMSLGLLASYSRAGWVTAMLVGAVVLVLRPRASSRIARSIVTLAVVIAAMYFTPLKESVIDQLPFIGTVSQNTIEYRQQLFDTALPLIREHPFFGDPFVYLNMEALRQGQGIIDIVNGYLFTALFSGLVGLTLQTGIFVAALFRGWAAQFRARVMDEDLGLMGAALLSCLAGSLFYIAAAGFETTQYVFTGLLVSYAVLVRSALTPPTVVDSTRRGDLKTRLQT
jgi:hypothetical protein